MAVLYAQTCTRRSQPESQHRQREACEVLLLAEVLLATGGCWEKERKEGEFSLCVKFLMFQWMVLHCCTYWQHELNPGSFLKKHMILGEGRDGGVSEKLKGVSEDKFGERNCIHLCNSQTVNKILWQTIDPKTFLKPLKKQGLTKTLLFWLQCNTVCLYSHSQPS